MVMSRPGPFLSTRGGINHLVAMAVSDALSRLVGAVVGYVFRLVALAHPAPATAPHSFDHILGAHLVMEHDRVYEAAQCRSEVIPHRLLPGGTQAAA